jgi:hypothetical protein
MDIECRVTMTTTNHKGHNVFFNVYIVMRHRYSFIARGRCASLVSFVTRHLFRYDKADVLLVVIDEVDLKAGLHFLRDLLSCIVMDQLRIRHGI